MITKVMQLDVQFAESWTGQYQQRAIEIYNPTCQTIRLANLTSCSSMMRSRLLAKCPSWMPRSEQTLAPQQTHVMCAQTGLAEPDMEQGSVDRMKVSQSAHILPNLVQSADTQCDVSPLSPDGATSWLLLPGLHGTLVLRRAATPKSADTVIYDVVEGVLAMNPLNSKGLSCSLAWVREQRVRTCSPISTHRTG